MSARAADAELERVLHAELEPGERLLWSTRPVRGVRLSSYAAFGLWIALMSSVPALGGAPPSNDERFTAPFLLALPGPWIGAFIAVCLAVLDVRHRATTCYGLTQRRILVVSTGFVRQVRAIDLADL